MRFPLSCAIVGILLLPVAAFGRAHHSPKKLLRLASSEVTRETESSLPPETLASILERCWRAQEIKSSRNTDFDQGTGIFHGEVHLRWCRASMTAGGPVERRGKRDYLSRIDSLTLRISTDSINAELRERVGQPLRLTVNGRAADAEWWNAGFRERVLRLAKVPLL